MVKQRVSDDFSPTLLPAYTTTLRLTTTPLTTTRFYDQYLLKKGGARWPSGTLQTGRSRVRFSMVSLEFFSDIILPVALWPWSQLSL